VSTQSLSRRPSQPVLAILISQGVISNTHIVCNIRASSLIMTDNIRQYELACLRPRQGLVNCFIFIRDRHLPSPHRQRWVEVRGPLVEVCIHPSYTRHAICLQKMHQHNQHVCRDCIYSSLLLDFIFVLQRPVVTTVLTPTSVSSAKHETRPILLQQK
jgi:hypothetical protein